MRTCLSILALVAAMFLTVGCGGGSSKSGSSSAGTASTASSGGGSASSAASTTTSGPPLSASQLAAKATSICRQLAVDLETGKVSPRTQQQIESIASRRLAFEKIALAELRTLTPPAASLGAWQQFIGLRQKVVGYLERMSADALANNKADERAVFVSSNGIEQLMLAPTKRLGIKLCAYVI